MISAMRGTWILGGIKTPAEVAVSAGVQTDFLKLIARLGCNSGDERKESNFLRGGQDLFQELGEKELHGSVKLYLSLLVGGHPASLNPVESG